MRSFLKRPDDYQDDDPPTSWLQLALRPGLEQKHITGAKVILESFDEHAPLMGAPRYPEDVKDAARRYKADEIRVFGATGRRVSGR